MTLNSATYSLNDELDNLNWDRFLENSNKLLKRLDAHSHWSVQSTRRTRVITSSEISRFVWQAIGDLNTGNNLSIHIETDHYTMYLTVHSDDGENYYQIRPYLKPASLTATVYEPNGSSWPASPANDQCFSYLELIHLIGGVPSENTLNHGLLISPQINARYQYPANIESTVNAQLNHPIIDKHSLDQWAGGLSAYPFDAAASFKNPKYPASTDATNRR